MLKRLARVVCRRPSVMPILWLVGCAVVTALAPSAERLTQLEPRFILGPDAPYSRAVELERAAFPQLGYRTRAVVVFERPGGLTDADRRYIADVAQRLAAPPDSAPEWRVLSPSNEPFLQRRLLSPDGEAAMIAVQYDANYVTLRSRRIVEHIESTARRSLPIGLIVEVTGNGGLGRDLSEASERALERTSWMTVTVVLVILLVVYRAPLAALVPLLSIGLTAVLTMRVFDLLAVAGWSIGAGERTFAVVLIFGSGTDFAMFWIARYRELLGDAPDRRAVAIQATIGVSPAILASGGTTIAGLSMLSMAELMPSQNAGRALALALGISLLAALTLIPAVATLMANALFWPRSRTGPVVAGDSGVWSRVANRVTRSPLAVVTISLLLLLPAVIGGLRIRYRYDGLGVSPPESSSAKGEAIARRHFALANLYSWSCLVQSDRFRQSPETADAWIGELTDALADTPGVVDVWSMNHPLGFDANTISNGALTRSLAGAIGRPFYISTENTCVRFEVMMDALPLSMQAMNTCERAIENVKQTAERMNDAGVRVCSTGFTPYIINIKSVADHDRTLVTWLVAAVIFAILLFWLRAPLPAGVMLGLTLIVYFATLGVTQFVNSQVFGVGDVDWKVRLILFVILVAVGQDYNIFLMSRLMQERETHPPAEATRRAIIRTGAVISGCGVIMAATLGSLTVAGLALYQQLGFALGFGILLDTFLIRPMVLPGLYLVIRRSGAKSFDFGRFMP